MGKLNTTDIIGKKFGNMIVLKLLEDKGWNSDYLLKCTRCGSEYKSKRQEIINKFNKHNFCANCKDRRRLDIVVGETIGNYTILAKLPNDEYSCKCKCGHESIQTRRNLLNIKLLEKKNPNAYKGPSCPHNYRLTKDGFHKELKEGEVYKNFTTIGKLKENLPGLRPNTKYYIFKCNKCGKLIYNQKAKLPITCAHRHLFTKDTFKKGEWYIYPQFEDLLKDEVINETESINEIKKENDMNMNPLIKYVLDTNKTVIQEKVIDILRNDPLVMNKLYSNANNFISDKIKDVPMSTDIDSMIKELISGKDFKDAVFGDSTFTTNIDTTVIKPKSVNTNVSKSSSNALKDINILKGYREMLKGINLLFTAKGVVPLSKKDLITFIKNDSIAEDVITYALNSRDIIISGKVYRTTDSMIANALYVVEKRIKELDN